MRGEQPIIYLAKPPVWFQGFVPSEASRVFGACNIYGDFRMLKVMWEFWASDVSRGSLGGFWKLSSNFGLQKNIGPTLQSKV